MAKGASSRRYTDEFKKDAVALYHSSGKGIAQVARELGVSDNSLSAWIHELDAAEHPSEAGDAKEIARLKKRARELEEEIEILKRFTKFWIKDSSK